MDKKYFDVLMESLEDAAAFSKGDASRARVVKFGAPPLGASRPGWGGGGSGGGLRAAV